MMQLRSHRLLVLLLFSLPAFINAQGVRPKNVALPGVPTLSNKYANEISTTDFNGRPFRVYEPDAEGSPFFRDELLHAQLVLSKGTVYEQVYVRIDLLNQELQLMTSQGKLIVAENGLVHQVNIIDSVTGVVQYRFISGCPPIDKQDGSHFYKLLSDGKLKLLFYDRRELVQEKNEMSGEIRKVYKARTDYYILQEGVIRKLKRDKESILALMDDHKEEVSKWLKDRKMNYRNNDMLAALFDYYNSLSPKSF